jgi:hypothetical protein
MVYARPDIRDYPQKHHSSVINVCIWKIRNRLRRQWIIPDQQPAGDDTPGVAVAPVALAGAVMPGVVRFIVMLSAHAAAFGVDTVVIIGSMLVPPRGATAG